MANLNNRTELLSEVKNLIPTMFDDKHNGNGIARSMPVQVGDTFTFTLSDKLFNQRDENINNELCSWVELVTDDGDAISATQITRRKNGLPLTGKTISERITSFLDLFNEQGKLTLKIKEIKQRSFQNGNGTTTSNYYVFEVA